MLNNDQIKLIQMAVKQAGIRQPKSDGRYRLLLSQYKQPNNCPVKSCKQLNNSQLEDLLAICEAHGWRMPNKPENYFRQKIMTEGNYASFAQQEAIKHLAGDLGWNEQNLAGFIKKMTKGMRESIVYILPREAWQIIEALKNILSRQTGTKYGSLEQIKKDMEVINEASSQI